MLRLLIVSSFLSHSEGTVVPLLNCPWFPFSSMPPVQSFLFKGILCALLNEFKYFFNMYPFIYTDSLYSQVQNKWGGEDVFIFFPDF